MSEQFDQLSEEHQSFIERQKVFFVATAAREGRPNLSPKGGPSVVVLAPKKLLWLNLTGSGNETAAHLIDSNRITLMWCAFEGPPLILRAFGSARAIYPEQAEWENVAARLPAAVGARQYFSIDVDLVQTSCGYSVPLMDYREDRTALTKWAEKKGAQGLRDYWSERNAESIDGLPTKAPI
ncbi:MAG: pyridoxamine 5'-phosphate oxidase [Deltaproteobacteria bacterium]|nr:pyridoxamine 5'-phosphate oxidase [Deltaproteobacteria bacterium]